MSSIAVACGGDDDDVGGGDAVVDDLVDAELPDDEADDDGFDDGGPDEGNVGDSGAMAGEMATLRMVNLTGSSEGGVDVDVIGPGADFSSDHVYGSVAYGEVADIEFPEGWDARLVRAGTDEVVGGPFTVHDDTEPGRVVAFRDGSGSTFGAFVEDRLPGHAAVGIVSAIADPDPNRRWRYSSPEGVCLFSVGSNVPAPMATPAEGGETSGILSLGLVGDFVWYIEPGPQVITLSDAAPDVFEQGEDCSSIAFDVEVEAVDGKAIFVAFFGASDDVRSTVYYEE
jgi:hypothetical protein